MKEKKVTNKKETKKGRKSREKGITLVALIVTIIVLLILAGVSIAMLTGNNGILTQAQKASEETEVASEKEAVSLAYTSAYTKNKGEGNVTDIQMQEALDENGTNANASGTGTLIVEFENGRTYMIDQNGNVTGPLEAPEETEEPETGGSIDTMLYGVIEIKWLMGDTNFVSESANAPVIKTDIPNTTMKLVNYDTNGTPVYSTDYNYEENRWANAEVEIDYGNNQKVKSYFVWIPRYAYRIIYFKDESSKTEYLNETKTENETIIEEQAIREGKIIGYSDSRGIVSIDTEGTIKKVSGTTSLNIGGNYFRVHPAFIDDSKNDYENGGWDEELPGIWVGKYETSLVKKSDGNDYNPVSTMIVDESSDYAIRVEQNKTFWRNVTIDNQYTSAKAYNTNLNSHMLKNSEWGAIAYLTESKYGRNGEEVTQNTDTSYKTANGNFMNNQNQSSTGNETGIYDLSGGVFERVAAYYSGSTSSNLINNGNSLVNDYANENTKKYVTAYIGTSVSSGYKPGDATYETSRWHGDLASFVSSKYPFFTRVCYSSGIASSGAGVFYYTESNGGSSSSGGCRMCLAVK